MTSSLPTLVTPRSITRRDVWVKMLLYPAHTLPTAAAPVAVATGLALHDHVFALGPALLAFVAGWLIQLGGVITDNYNNLTLHEDDEEHADFVQALREGTVTMRELRLAIYGTYALAGVFGLYLMYIGGLPVVVFGLLCVLASLIYSTGPFPLGDNGLGDLLFFVFFGLASVGGAYYVQVASVMSAPMGLHLLRNALGWDVLLASLPMAALITNILIIDNIRDLEYDRAKREHTLAVLIGPMWSRVEYVLGIALAYAIPLVLWRRGFGASVLLPLATFPLAAMVAHQVMIRQTHESLIPMTPRAGQVALSFGILFAIGLAVG